jgi:pimeloyl-ACP methyl ester carboxylesterase
MIKALRTPDERFLNLPGYSFAPNYLTQANGLRMHYVDEGAQIAGAAAFLCLHGQPTWSYLYRKMIPILAGHGRVIAPDLFGFGRSDKPVEEEVYTITFHRNALIELIKQLDLRNITLVCQDWGGLIGLTIPCEMPDRFSRLIVMNTAFPTGEVKPGAGFEAWKQFNRANPDLDIAVLIKSVTPILSDEEAAAYSAPFPDQSYKAGVRSFPELLPTSLESPGSEYGRAGRDWFRDNWKGQSFMAIGGSDPVISAQAMYALRQNIRNCPEPLLIPEAGHFVQEWGEQVCHAALALFRGK